jgi:hyperosmotically inducible periplasmic protein
MPATRLIAIVATLSLILSFGCAQQRATNPSVKENVEKSLEQAGMKDINVDEDRDKGVVTLKGEVPSQEAKARAEETARQVAGNAVIANEILVTGGNEDKAEDVSTAQDDAIEASFKAWVAKNNLDDQNINFDSKNGVLTLTGDVANQKQRTMVEKEAAKIEGVTQVVNKLEIQAAKR